MPPPPPPPPPMQGMPPPGMMQGMQGMPPPPPGMMQGMPLPPLPPNRPPPMMEGTSMQQQDQRPTTQQFAGLGTMTKKSGNLNNRNRTTPTPLSNQYQAQPPPPRFQPPPPPPLPPLQPPLPPPMMREEGYLGDSTLHEISLDYSIPIPYLADVLTSWGVPVPIDPNDRLGDLVTAQQAYAILEAIYTLDVASLHDRYSEENILSLCDIYDMDIKAVFEYCVERGWGLPFGVRTFLRVEQEEELLDVMG
ncbi:hypothetical protein ACHAXH_008022 [Discostella pseudostelligera]